MFVMMKCLIISSESITGLLESTYKCVHLLIYCKFICPFLGPPTENENFHYTMCARMSINKLLWPFTCKTQPLKSISMNEITCFCWLVEREAF